jgi:hypothetical protein
MKRTTTMRALKLAAVKTDKGIMGSSANFFSQMRNAIISSTDEINRTMTYGVCHPVEGA